MTACSIPNDVTELESPGEQPVAAYATFRDSAVLTTMRLIVRNAQGPAGKKVDIRRLDLLIARFMLGVRG